MALNEADAQALRDHLDALLTREPDMVGLFYQRLFTTHPHLAAHFDDSDAARREKHLLEMLFFALANLKHPHILGPALQQLGDTHRRLGIAREALPGFNEVMLQTMASVAGNTWHADHAARWRMALDTMVDLMNAGYDAA